VKVESELSHLGCLHERSLFQDALFIQNIQYSAGEDEEPAAHVLVKFRLLSEALNLDGMLIRFDDAKPGLRMDSGHGGHLSHFKMKSVEFRKVDVGDAIPVGHHEMISLEVLFDSLDSSAGHRFQPGEGKGHAPVVDLVNALNLRSLF
jgi:hypothetical protein